LVGLAVNVTLVPGQIAVEGLAAIASEGVTEALTDIVITFELAFALELPFVKIMFGRMADLEPVV
jgi:hypothetical protein